MSDHEWSCKAVLTHEMAIRHIIIRNKFKFPALDSVNGSRVRIEGMGLIRLTVTAKQKTFLSYLRDSPV